MNKKVNMNGKTNLLPHNVEIYERLEAMVEEHGKAIVVTATGTGKSFLAMEYLNNHDYNALVVCPKRAICQDWDARSDRITTMTYHKFARQEKVEPYDCYIFDEAHHCGSPVWGKAVRKLMEETSAPVIGLTADSQRYSDGGRDVAEEIWDGCAVYGYTQDSAIEAGVLPAATYVCTLFSAEKLAEKYRRENVSRALLARLDYSVQNCGKIEEVIRRHMPAGPRKGIVFVDSIEYVDEAESLIRGIFPYANILAVHSKMPQAQVTANLTAFRQLDEGYLIAIDMLNEGLHVRGVNTLIMLRKTSSPTVFMQQLGRSLATENKDIVVYDFVGNRCSMKTLSLKIEAFKESVGEKKNSPRRASQLIVHDYASDILSIVKDIKRELANEWTEDEVAILREFYPQEGRAVVNRLPGRTPASCTLKANALGLMHSICWTDDEIAILREFYPQEGRAVAVRLPGRSPDSCTQKANALGFAKVVRWSDTEIAILREFYPQEGKAVASRLPGRAPKNCADKASELGLEKYGRWTDEEITILREFYHQEGTAVAARLPGRTSVACAAKAQLLGLVRKKGWTTAELATLREFYPQEGTAVAVRLPGRSPGSCTQKANALGLACAKASA